MFKKELAYIEDIISMKCLREYGNVKDMEIDKIIRDSDGRTYCGSCLAYDYISDDLSPHKSETLFYMARFNKDGVFQWIKTI